MVDISTATEIVVEELPPAEQWRGTFSAIYAGALQTVSHTAMLEMVPSDVNLVLTTKPWSPLMLHGGSFDAEAFAKRRDEIVLACREIVDFVPTTSFLCVTGDLILAAMGPEWCRRLSQEVEEIVQVPTLTAMEVVVRAMQHLDVARIALVSPFAGDRTAFVRDYLQAEGIEVVVGRAVTRSTNATMRDMPATFAHDLAIRAVDQAGSRRDAIEAIYMPSPVWRTSRAISTLEEELDIPVLTWMNTILWHGLTAIGDTRPVSGYGRLLATPAAASDNGAEA